MTRRCGRAIVSAIAFAACCSLATPAAFAQATADANGTVLGIDADDIVVDLGASKGASEGVIVELWRPFKLRHPVTRQMLTDRFRIGALRLVQVRSALALARPEGELARPPAVGDIVILLGKAPAAGRPAATATTESDASAGPTAEPHGADAADPEGRELCTMFDALKGQPPAARIARYEQQVRTRPQSRYARVLREEAIYLRRLHGADGGAVEPKTAGRAASTFHPPESAVANEPLTIGVEMPSASGAVLHVRHAGEVAYLSHPMHAAGAGYFRATIAPVQMKAPQVEYFIESVNTQGAAAPLVGTAEAPQTVEVQEPPRPEPPPNPSATVAVFTDYADYNRLRGNDFAWQTEGYFGLRYRDVGVRAVRSGFGVYRGVGGSVYDLDALRLRGRKVGLTYGYLEGEYATSAFIGLIARLALGLTDEGVNGGGQFFVRLGNDKLTNLLLGCEVLGSIGLRGIAELQWNTLPRVPIVIRTEVTNQPAGAPARRPFFNPETTDVSTQDGDIGARAMVQIGYRLVPSFTLAIRASYEGRTIQHAGPGAGVGATYSW